MQLLKRNGQVRSVPDGGARAIGVRLRQLRVRRGLSLARVAKAVGISVGFLSALERSHMSASVSTLRKLARYYKTNILDFFDPAESNVRLVSPGEAQSAGGGPGSADGVAGLGQHRHGAASLPHRSQSGSGESYTHEGEEFLYILQGELQISLEEEKYRLQPGDSFYFESATPHRWKNPGRSETLDTVGEHSADILTAATFASANFFSRSRRKQSCSSTGCSSQGCDIQAYSSYCCFAHRSDPGDNRHPRKQTPSS